jgi:hypothetical protein
LAHPRSRLLSLVIAGHDDFTVSVAQDGAAGVDQAQPGRRGAQVFLPAWLDRLPELLDTVLHDV